MSVQNNRALCIGKNDDKRNLFYAKKVSFDTIFFSVGSNLIKINKTLINS